MKQSALRSVFIFRGRGIGLDCYKSKEFMSRVVVILDIVKMVISQMEEVIIYLAEIGVLRKQ